MRLHDFLRVEAEHLQCCLTRSLIKFFGVLPTYPSTTLVGVHVGTHYKLLQPKMDGWCHYLPKYLTLDRSGGSYNLNGQLQETRLMEGDSLCII